MVPFGLRSFIFLGLWGICSVQCEEATWIRVRRTSDREKDALACRELREEYRAECTKRPNLKSSNEFCVAFENVCFQIHEQDPDQPSGISRNRPDEPSRGISRRIQTTEPPPPSPVEITRPDYTQFCQEYKQRFLYVCPDPFRFGQRAAVFCPVYSERCNVPIPEKPVTPTDRPPLGIQQSTQRICAQFRNFAVGYCSNPFALLRPEVAQGCEKYNRFCTRQG